MNTQEYKQILSDSDHFFSALITAHQSMDFSSRFHGFAQAFVGTPYCLNALGEGVGADFDQYPHYRSDAVDCVTLINTLLALLMSHSVCCFKKNMALLSYGDNKIAYAHRFHFTVSQWNVSLSQRGVLQDITKDLSSLLPRHALCHSHVQIDQQSWYARKTIQDVRLLNDASNEKKQHRLDQLLLAVRHLVPLESHIDFITFEALFSLASTDRHLFYAAIPCGVIVEIVRRDWTIEDVIGTPLDVCHMGLIRQVGGEVYCQHASSLQGEVVMELCDDFFRSWLTLDSSSGINFQQIIIDETN
tara:strand:- start:664 stop:1569 length:906 start_codon:yes stop_codon:yes gene_type:complete